ncbi:cytochrome d ubiquinol oxidase subunit II [Salipiger sp. IMCC34102]|uniref:cytochrome d ubiquinol oxidase subunit II n=1 Tax=Salipiger sp. IMCC34102 TaxID=2510647 RepID=UPI00101D1935|nr:cytochrome d ubiquinol oxidase subunit II [Salipiger sp. IMCC34102]RYH04577.1 cytochrome d ubiquinol oxidase subunit II [Salipiger sp. IMCC34102]
MPDVFLELSFIWAGLIAFAVLTYVVLDGFDLGIGILFPFAHGEGDRDVMMNSVAPVWDGNETWLVLGGGGLFAVFPLAYSIVMPALYMPIILMLLALVFRGVAFEYRWKTTRWRGVWDLAFFGGSTMAALNQGIALGALVQGIDIDGRAYGGGWWDWLTPFSIMCGLAVTVGYALLGATWIVMKTNGAVSHHMRDVAKPLAVVVLIAVAIVSIWTPFQNADYFGRWFSMPSFVFTLPIPILLLICIVALFTGLATGRDRIPFLAVEAIFVLCFIGIGVSFYPYIVPPALTIREAAAPDSSLWFALVGTIVLIPLILIYTAYAYYVFRGKIDPDEGYH